MVEGKNPQTSNTAPGAIPSPPPQTLKEVAYSKLISFVKIALSVSTLGGLIIVLAMLFVYNVAIDPVRMVDVGYSRALITLLFSVGTIVIALVLAFAAVFQNAESSSDELLEKRFARGKEVLTALIGIFGTILGFYFGTVKDDPRSRPSVEAIESAGGVIESGVVFLDNPSVTDATLMHLRRLPYVEKLYLDRASITDGGLVYLYDLPNLQFLSLGGTKVSSAAVAALQDSIERDGQRKNKLTVRHVAAPINSASTSQGAEKQP